MMKKRLSSILLALALCLTLLPTAALAVGTQKPWEESTGWINLNDYYNENKDSELLTTGNYYLIDDLLTHDGVCFEVTGGAEVIVDLNGHHFVDDNDDSSDSRFRISNGGKFTLQDSTGGGFISGLSTAGVVEVEESGSFTLNSGMVIALANSAAVLCKTGSTFTMEGGTLYSLTNNATTVQLQNGGTFTLNGGAVKASSLSSEGIRYTTNAVILLYDSNDEVHPEKPMMNANGGTVEGTVVNLGGTIQSDKAQKATVFTDALCLTVDENEIVSTGKRDSSVVHNGGIVSGGVFKNTVINHCDLSEIDSGATGKSDGTITSGYFHGKLTINENSTITGGYFTFSPAAGVHNENGYYVNPSDTTGYAYMVNTDASNLGKALVYVYGITTTTVASGVNMSASDKTNIEANTSVTGVDLALSDFWKNDICTKADCGNLIKITVEAEVTDYDKDTGALSFTATPTYLLYNGDGTCSGTEGIGYTFKNEWLDGKAITVSLPLPTGYAPKQIKYTAADGSEQYLIKDGTMRGAGSFQIKDGCAVFAITQFSTSPYELSETVTYVEPVIADHSDPTYAISIQDADHGSVALSVKRKYAWEGDTVTLLVTPDRGWTLETLSVLDKNGKAVEVTAKNGKYTFKMPDSKVTVTATFMEDNSMLSFFVDVPVDSYYHDAVLWAAENGITGGVDDTHFAPYATCTRGQLAAFLYRYARSQGKGFTGAWMFRLPFTDVPEWCYEAVAWCYMNDIVGGYGDGRFGPNDTVTRQQAVAILYRFAQAMDMDVSVGEDTNILSYNDAFDVSEYAVSAFQWAVGAGIVQGDNGDLNPGTGCTRAQIVTFLYRLLGD